MSKSTFRHDMDNPDFPLPLLEINEVILGRVAVLSSRRGMYSTEHNIWDA